MRAVLWDFDGTLAQREGRWSSCLVEVLDEHEPGHAVSRDTLRAALRDGFPWHRAEVPHVELSDPDAWWAAIHGLLAGAYATAGYETMRARELAALVRQRYVDPAVGWQLYDDTLPTLRLLQSRGWRNVVVSNHVPELGDLVAGLGLGDLVDAVVNSAVTGYEKPHPEAFAAARAAAGEPETIWMVGDNPVADVQGAQAVGIPALLVRGTSGRTLADVPDLISQSDTVGGFTG